MAKKSAPKEKSDTEMADNGVRRSAPRDFLTGQLLIAMPNMTDPRFERTVILICAHDETHAMGVIVNKPIADLTLSELVEQLEIDPQRDIADKPAYFGGPVQTERGLVLHSLDYETPATLKITSTVGMTGSREILEEIVGASPNKAPPNDYLLAIGYAGWSGGQLEEELSVNAWAHCDSDREILFARDPSTAWTAALSKLGVTGAMLSPEWASPRRGDAPLN